MVDLPVLENFDTFTLEMFPEVFARLRVPEDGELLGDFRSALTGPGWLRSLAPAALELGGLGGWQGKRFLAGGQGTNLVRRWGRVREVLPFTCEVQPSLIDRMPSAVVRYRSGSALPWPWVVDELRWLGQGWLLGMTLLASGPLRRGRLASLAVPFLLQQSGHQPAAG